MTTEPQTTHTFYVQGMHCPACVILTEDKIGEMPRVSSAKANLAELSMTVTGDFGEASAKEIADTLTEPIASYGYTLVLSKDNLTSRWTDFKFAAPLALCVIILFIALQKLGIVNLVQTGNVTYGTAFVIGIIASVSTCMAVVGGLVLSMSASFSKQGKKVLPQVLFHIGRLITFFALGGVIGMIGASVQLNSTTVFVMNVLIALTLLILGINLLNIFPWAQRFQLTMPKALSRRLLGIQKVNSIVTPVLVGAVTFFLPCGFTQSMQIYTLSTGSFMAGALTMLSFALGTLPVLAAISFTSVAMRKPMTQSIFFKTTGLIVIFFAVFNFLAGLVVLGVIPPIFNF